MLYSTSQLLPHLIKQVGEDSPTLVNDGIELYDVPSDQVWELKSSNGESCRIIQVQKLSFSSDTFWYLYQVFDFDGEVIVVRKEENEYVDVDTYSLVPLVLVV